MNIGMLWFDNDKKAELAAKVERAVTYYRNKYGTRPNLCMVNPSMLVNSATTQSSETGIDHPEGTVLRAAGVEIRSNRSVLPNHLWIGVNGKFDPKPMVS